MSEPTFQERTIIMTVAKYEADIETWYEKGKADQREIDAFR